MAELPDLQVFAINLNKYFQSKKLLRVKVINGKKLKDSANALDKNLNGQVLKRIFRSGKELRFEFASGQLLGMHLMLTGDIFEFTKNNEHKFTIIEFYFEGGIGLALTDRMKNANVKLDPSDKAGVDAISRQLNFKYLKGIFKSNRSIKDILMDQDLIRGIGNSYSDEILWTARINPYSIAQALPDEKIKELSKLIKKILKDAIKKIIKVYPDKINVEVKSFMKVHTKERLKSPTGKVIKIDTKGMRKTYYTEEQILYK